VSIVFTSDVLGNVSVNEITYRDTYWDDLRVGAGQFWRGTAGNPNQLVWKTTLALYEFTTGDQLYFTTQMPHTYKEGTDIKPHIHWTPHTRGVIESGKTVNWRLDLTVKNIDGIFGAATTYDLTDTCDGADEKHQFQYATADISGTGLTISNMLVGRLYRLAGDTWTTNTPGNNPALLELDFHYEMDSPGAHTDLVK
jgi:hypothetical protein